MSNDLRWIAPTPPESDNTVLEFHQLSRAFYEEVQHRQQFAHYCEQYYAIAEKHRQEARKMQGDFNFLGWFYRRRK